MIHIIPTEKFTTNIICVLARRKLDKKDVTSTALLPPLLARGSEKYPTVQSIRQAAEAMQGGVFDAQIVKKGEQQILQFFLEYVDGDLTFKKQGLEFLREIILRPYTEHLKEEGFYAPYVKGESENLENRIKGRINNISEYARLKCLEIMCEGEPFGIYGDGYAEDLPAITSEGLFKHYKEVCATSPVDFIALGKWDKAWLDEQVAKFGLLSGSSLEKEKLYPARANREIVKINHGTTQGNLCIGLRGQISPVGMDFIHLQLASEILGGGPNAKLFSNIREAKSLCYSIFSTIYRFKSLMCVVAGTEPDKMEKVMELAELEIDAMKNGDFSETDLHSAKQSLINRWRTMQDNPSACVDFYASQFLLGDTNTLDEMLDMVGVATKEGVSRVMAGLDIDTVVMMQ